MKKILIKSMILVVVIFLSVLFLLPSTTYADSSKIAFASYRDGDWEIYIMNVDGSGQTRLTNNPGGDYEPDFSPDGTKIAFTSYRDENTDIYIMNTDGSGLTRLTNNPAYDVNPAFSPDGSKIAFESYRDGGNEIYIMNVDGSGQTRITYSHPGYTDCNPDFSPDGSKIVWESRNGYWDIYIMNVDGSGQTNLSNNPLNDCHPAFSPDGSKIAFVSDRDAGIPYSDIFVMNVDGSGQTNLSNNTAKYNASPAFSPDVSKIAFASDRDGNWDIYIMNSDGSEVTRLTNNPAEDQYPAFSPDGTPADTTPPVIDPFADIIAEATSSTGAVVTFSPTATDNVDPSVTVVCSPASGSTFPLGTTLVTANAQDAAGNPAIPVTFNVTVEDKTAPVITILGINPVNIYIGDLYNDEGATATDNVDGDITANIKTINNVNTAIKGTYTVIYTVKDTSGNEVTATRTVNVSSHPPVAVNDGFAFTNNRIINIPTNILLSNDYDPEGDPISFVSITQGTGGKATYSASLKRVTFKPDRNFMGLASFSYTIKDSNNLQSSATVWLSIGVNQLPNNLPPIAAPDTLSTNKVWTAISISGLLTNDSDPEGTAISFVSVGKASNNATVMPGFSQLLLVVKRGYTGTITFPYIIKDASGLQSTGVVTVNVTNARYF